MIKAIITDIEGTTTSISFVFDVLFPYARKRIVDFINAHADEMEIRSVLDEVVSLAGIENDLELISTQLIEWIDQDKKITPLKTLQGIIWKAGYESGDFKGHLYPDVEPQLKLWKDNNIELYVFSSGSVAAQKLLFGYSESGDLTDYFSSYFDTKMGNKREVDAYENILQKLNYPAHEVLFLSDIEQELDAARQAGIQVLQLVRKGTVASSKHRTVRDFSEIDLTQF